MTDQAETIRRVLLGALCEAAQLALDGAGASVTLLDETAADLVFVAVAGAGSDWLVGGRFPAHEGVAGHVARTGELIDAADLARDPRFADEVGVETGYAPNRLTAAPLRHGERVVGVLSVLDPQLAPGHETRVRLAALAKHAEAALRLSDVLSRSS